MKPIKFKLSISQLGKMFPKTSVLSWTLPTHTNPKPVTRVLHTLLRNATGISIRAHPHWEHHWNNYPNGEVLRAKAVTLFFENDEDAIEFKLRFM